MQAPAPAPALKTTTMTHAAPVQTARVEPASGSQNIFAGAPAHARPGECYGRVTTPATYRTVQDKVLVEEGGKQLARITPATYQNQTATVTVREATEELVTIPATYKTV